MSIFKLPVIERGYVCFYAFRDKWRSDALGLVLVFMTNKEIKAK